MKELKIKIKEVVEDRRKLTADEEFIYNLECGIGIDYLTEKGIMPLSRIADQSYVFRKETIRDVTPEEYAAYLISRFPINDEFAQNNRYVYQKANDILKDKEIILELEETDD
jgi:hypothetical protein